MRVFVTGATGWVGSVTVRELLKAGHQVVGLARTDAGASDLAAIGAEPLRGDLADIDGLKRGAADADGVIHTAFIHDFARFQENCDIDARAIDALGEALAGSNKPLVVTSGTTLLSPGRLATEATRSDAPTPALPRRSEQAADALLASGVAASAVRLPPTVHGEGDHGFVPILVGLAREKGISAYVEGAGNHWSAVHRLDAAKVFRRAIEVARPGARYHAIAEEGVPFRDIAAVIARRLGVPLVGLAKEEAAAHFGWFSHFAAIDSLASSGETRRELGWEPTGPGLIEDLDQAYYFKA